MPLLLQWKRNHSCHSAASQTSASIIQMRKPMSLSSIRSLAGNKARGRKMPPSLQLPLTEPNLLSETSLIWKSEEFQFQQSRNVLYKGAGMATNYHIHHLESQHFGKLLIWGHRAGDCYSNKLELQDSGSLPRAHSTPSVRSFDCSRDICQRRHIFKSCANYIFHWSINSCICKYCYLLVICQT